MCLKYKQVMPEKALGSFVPALSAGIFLGKDSEMFFQCLSTFSDQTFLHLRRIRKVDVDLEVPG